MRYVDNKSKKSLHINGIDTSPARQNIDGRVMAPPRYSIAAAAQPATLQPELTIGSLPETA